MVKNPPATAGDAGHSDLTHGWGRSPGVGNGNPLQYTCLENPMDRGAWWAAVHGLVQLDTTLQLNTHEFFFSSILLKFPNVRILYLPFVIDY